MEQKVVTRFAPSPTGFMHIGGVRTALFAYLWARKNKGTFILRIEDTDQERKVEGSIEHIQETLHWLGLEWDFGPDKPGSFGSCIQSERLETYQAAALQLIEKGFAYPDPYSAEEVDAFRKQAQAEKRPFLFRDHRPATFGEWDGKRPLRFRVPEVRRSAWHDAVRGDLEAGEEALDDFILIKADGYPTYNLAHIIDDYHMGVTHVMRADEFISSTPKFLSLYEALGIMPPVFVTLPPILREDRTKKLGKRDGARDVLEYRDEGYLPEAMMNFLALIGWNPGTDQEIFTREELITQFSLEGIQKAGAVLNEEKLRWFNRQHLLSMPEAEFETQALAVFTFAFQTRTTHYDEERARRLVPILRERIQVWSDISAAVDEGEYDFAFMQPTLDPALIPGAKSDPKTAKIHLEAALALCQKAPESSFIDPEAFKVLIWPYADENGRGAVLWPLRYALTGRERSPDPFTVASLLGKAETELRITAAIEQL